jgi:hypothetical protein
MPAAGLLLVLLVLLVLAAAAAGAAPIKYEHHAGALMAGSDVGMAQNLTTAEATAHCTALPECAGFTFECAAGGSAGCPATSTAPLKTFFKSSTAGNTDAGWQTYIKMRPHLLAASFSSHMVLQHDSPCLWGFGKAGDAVQLTLNTSTAGTITTTVATNGSWFACLPPQPASHDSATVNVTVGAEQTALEDVLFGEVWVASGQSNMAFSVTQAFNHTEECADSISYPELRLFTVAVNFDWGKFHKGEPRVREKTFVAPTQQLRN